MDFFQQLMAVLFPLDVSFLHSLSTCSSQLGSFASVCVAVPAMGMQNTFTFQFSRYSVRPVQFFLCSNSDLWISTCFFLLLLLTAIFQVATDVPAPLELTAMGVRHRSCGCLTSSLGEEQTG